MVVRELACRRSGVPAPPRCREIDPSPLPECFMIFGGPSTYKSRHKQKLTHREICAAEPATPSFLRWSDSTIIYDRSNQTEYIRVQGGAVDGLI